MEQIETNLLIDFKKTYKKFIYAKYYPQVIEYSFETAGIIFLLETFQLMKTETAQKIRKFMLENLKTDQDWKKRLISFTV